MMMTNRLQLHHFHIARFVLEADSAFSIASGITDAAFDNLVVRDANHLPALPGTTIAGVLRQMYRSSYPGENDNQLFGYQDRKGGVTSRVEFSWGVIHDSSSKPVEELQEKISDSVLDRLSKDHPHHRDRVRINNRGVADHQAKFDVTIVPKGCRFSLEMSLWADAQTPPEWGRLLGLIKYPGLRLGASVRSGMGRFKCIKLHTRVLDLTSSEDFKKYQAIGSSLADVTGWREYDEDQAKQASGVECVDSKLTLILEPEDFWRFGQGRDGIKECQKTPDMLPYVEPVIRWLGEQSDQASFGRDYVVIPGSSVKGAIRHRFLFHYARLQLKQEEGSDIDAPGKLAVAAANKVFGYAADTAEGRTDGQAGALYFSDLYIDVNTLKDGNEIVHMMHTSIDRFTGGVRYGLLYAEELIWKHPLKLKLEFEPRRCETFDRTVAKALQWTFDDLTNGRLALGASSSKGHGYFSGRQAWRNRPAWMQQSSEEAA